jgi:acyl-coenzyme A synthetase/AMP-(fatty) acid ligase
MGSMIFIQNDGNIIHANVNFEGHGSKESKKSFVIPDNTNKITQVHDILEALHEGNIPLLFDSAMMSSEKKIQSLLGNNPNECDALNQTAALFFTSGTSGNPIGVMKRQEHLMRETLIHKKWLENEFFEQCLVTVPFFHIYGFLFGLSLPITIGLEIVTKEHFLPNEIVTLCEAKPTLCITNPVFIRAMLRLRDNIDLSNTLFISSSGPLEPHEAALFEEKYSTRLTQLYGSSETGGIAVRSGGESIWKPLQGVKISSDEGVLRVESPFVSSTVYDQTFMDIGSPFRTTDIIEIAEEGFKIIGRASELVKIGGKRLSIIEIETFLEKMEGINEALGEVEYHPQRLRGETLSLYLVGDESKIHKTVLKKALHDYFGGIHIESKITMVEKIEKSAMGKKIRSRLMT